MAAAPAVRLVVQFVVVVVGGDAPAVEWYFVPADHELAGERFVRRFLEADGDHTGRGPAPDAEVERALSPFAHGGIGMSGWGAAAPPGIPAGCAVVAQHWRYVLC